MHTPLGAAFAACAEHILGSRPSLHVFDVTPDVDTVNLGTRIRDCITEATETGSIVLCDLYGATPFNIAQNAVAQARAAGGKACLLTGANLNMVLKALTERLENPGTLRDSARDGAERGIVSIGDQC